jgi:carboxypeptidase PM20D1
MTGGTDSKHYADLTVHGILRFSPYRLNKTAGDMARIHGTNERVAVADFARAQCTYRRVIELMSQELQ